MSVMQWAYIGAVLLGVCWCWPGCVMAQGNFEIHPLEGSRQEAKPLPSTTFDIFPVVFRSVVPTPDLWPQTHPCFLTRGVGRVGAAPSTHQDQGL